MDDAAQLKAIAAGDADAFAQWLAGAEPRVRASLMSWAAVLDVDETVLDNSVYQLERHTYDLPYDYASVMNYGARGGGGGEQQVVG